ncbi:MAG: helix-turn-helix domain-containing protein [Chthoniobacterales bacterium]|nr:helix-turn-helix domain-containing protein [Chthoniobacterales bacterium]
MSANIEGKQEADSVTIASAAKHFSVCSRTLRREIERGRLSAFRVGRSLRIRTQELNRYMQARAIGGHHA